MARPVCFERAPPTTTVGMAPPTRLFLTDASKGMLEIRGPARFAEAGPADLAFFDSPNHADQLACSGEERE
jgi:hypothetical protein